MREYAKLAPKFYAGEVCRALRRMDPSGKGLLVWLYLQSSPHSNMLGLYYQPIPFMGFELGIGEQEALKGLEACIELKLCTYDSETFTVWVYDMAAEQIAPELKATDLRCKGIQSDYDNLQDNPFLGPWFDRYAQAFHLTRRREGTRETPLFSQGAYQAPSKPGAGAGAGTGERIEAREERARAPKGKPETPEPPRQATLPPPPTPGPAAPPEVNGHEPTPAGRICKAMRQAGLVQTNPGDPRFIALLEQGAVEAEFVGLAREAVDKGKASGWAWILATLQARRAEAASIALAAPAPKPNEPTGRMPLYVAPPPLTPEEREAADRRRREVMAQRRGATS